MGTFQLSQKDSPADNDETVSDPAVAEAKGPKKPAHRKISIFASVPLSITLMVLMAATILLGAWCPQESQVGQAKVFEAFDRQTAELLVRAGVSDIFHSTWFLALTALMSLNIVVVSFQRVFPKLSGYLKRDMPFFAGREISKLPAHATLVSADSTQTAAILATLSATLTRLGYKVKMDGDRLMAESGRYGRLSASITHVGLLSLMAGISITSWTGFTGFQPVLLGQALNFDDAKHASLWIGKKPDWTAKVESSRRENYPTGEAKQWYSNLSVIKNGKAVKTQEISVNNPLSYDNVDIYQSSWGLDQVVISFNDKERTLSLQSMGQKYAAFLPLDADTMLVLSLNSEGKELRVFGKRREWEAPKLLQVVPVGQSISLGDVQMKFVKVLPITGLQYKCDPGLPVTYVAFIIIMVGIFLAAVPHRHFWCAVEKSDNGALIYLGGTSRKAKVGFERGLDKIKESLSKQFNLVTQTKIEDTP
ncbi:MAG: cytochrome c biogenesis protein ResB [Candidatus Obscuribacter sp.]|nr:cytochrome c biogenesis protein ResB [Candidatus Obscuribacter sp.]MBP6348543.1 cytochrome c biogenesis protein ResB [Candidatus Obscuribacter sp.]MBP6593394.1 cytochrome c biogenesis protein ResB [Candidatus Obscuribacter sp.]MBP7575660.1 cytochrome c biogenesis protein ResB [Candidatus Obscuribacter sp.]